MKRLAPIALAALAWVLPPARAASSIGGYTQTFRGEGAKLTLEAPFAQPPRFGFTPLRLAIDNQLARDVQWQASFQAFANNGSSTTNQRTHQDLAVAGGRAHERWIFVPLADGGVAPSGYSYRGPLSGTVSGPGLGNISFVLNNAPAVTPRSMVPWAVSASLENVVRTRIDGIFQPGAAPAGGPPPTMTGRGGSRGGGPAGPRRLVQGPYSIFAFEPTAPMPDWRIWSPFARVVLREGEFAALDAPNRVALRNWVALGGTLYLAPDAGPAGATEHFGAGSIVRVRGSLAGGDGAGLFTEQGLLGGTLAQPAAGDLSQENTRLSDQLPRGSDAGDWLVYFFIAFALIVGPVNLFVLAPPRRRHRLFFTVPATSFVAVLGLGATILVQDGFGGEGLRRALVVLLPGDNQAAVFQEQVTRTGMLSGSQFALADDTLCAQVAVISGIPGATGPALERWPGRAGGDWFRSRAVQAQHLRRLTPTRARVEQVGLTPQGAPVVQSSVSATLRDFCYIDDTGNAWGAATLPTGTRVELTRLPDPAVFAQRVEQFGGMSSIAFAQLTRAGASPGGETRGRFIALADDTDLAPLATLDAIRWADSAVLMTGALERGGPQPGGGEAGE